MTSKRSESLFASLFDLKRRVGPTALSGRPVRLRKGGETCAICGKSFASDPEDRFRHATGELVHMTCYDRMWEQ